MYKRGDIQIERQYGNAFDKFQTKKMQPPSKLVEQIAFNTTPEKKEHMLVVMDKSIHEEHLSKPLQTKIKQSKIAVTFLTGYKGIFNVTDKNNIFYFAKSTSDEDGFIQITIPTGAYEIERLNNENKRNIIDEGHFTEADSRFTIKPNFCTVGFIIESSRPEPLISFLPDDSIRNHLEFKATTKYEEFNLSPNPVDIFSFDIIFLGCDTAQGMIHRGKIIHNWTMTVHPGYR